MISNSACCGNIARLTDLVGSPVEFRKLKGYAPQIGAKWICPSCGGEYFARWQRIDKFWDNVNNSFKKEFLTSKGLCNNDFFEKFVQLDSNGKLSDTGAFIISLEIYESENWSLNKVCVEEEDTQLVYLIPEVIT